MVFLSQKVCNFVLKFCYMLPMYASRFPRGCTNLQVMGLSIVVPLHAVAVGKEI